MKWRGGARKGNNRRPKVKYHGARTTSPVGDRFGNTDASGETKIVARKNKCMIACAGGRRKNAFPKHQTAICNGAHKTGSADGNSGFEPSIPCPAPSCI